MNEPYRWPGDAAPWHRSRMISSRGVVRVAQIQASRGLDWISLAERALSTFRRLWPRPIGCAAKGREEIKWS